MKLRSTAFIFSLLIVFSAAPVIKAQDPTASPAATEVQTDEQKQKEKEAAEKKAVALLEQIVGEVQLLRLPENRIRVQIAAGDLLWQRTEERARSLFSLSGEGGAEIL